MSITIPAIPTLTDPTETTTDPTSHAQAWALVNAKYSDAWKWSEWATRTLQLIYNDISSTFNSEAIDAALEAIDSFVEGVGAFAHIPVFASNTDFAAGNDALTALKDRIAADLETRSTGLGEAVEEVIFARELLRVERANSLAFDAITQVYSAGGWDLPPGAVGSQATRLATEAAQNLTESSGKILEESARLALDYDKFVLDIALKLQAILADVFNSHVNMEFEASKINVSNALAVYSENLIYAKARTDIEFKRGDMAIQALQRTVALELETSRSLAQGVQQMIASSLNSVSSSTSFGFGGSVSTSYTETTTTPA